MPINPQEWQDPGDRGGAGLGGWHGHQQDPALVWGAAAGVCQGRGAVARARLLAEGAVAHDAGGRNL